jgi:TonB family protein
MMAGHRCVCTFVLLAAISHVVVASAAAQQPVDGLAARAEKLYAAAAYEEVLSLLEQQSSPWAQQYRALCLLALGRQQDAEAAVEALVTAAPEFTSSVADVPPRFAALVTRVRREVLPDILLQLFADGREQYRGKAMDAAVARFERLIALSAGVELRDVAEVADLRLLAEGFLDLAKTPRTPAPPPQVSEVAATPAPPPVTPASPRPATPPVAMRQDIPPWPSALSIRATHEGAVRIQISKEGRVTAASIVKSVHPRYDIQLLAATRFWSYIPATVDGLPVDSESVVQVRLKPPRSAP